MADSSAKRLASWKAYRERHREERLAQRQRWLAAHPERAKYYRTLDYARHSDAHKARAKRNAEASQMKDPEGFLLKQRKAKYRAKLAIIALLGGGCVRCGFSDERALQVDHVNANPLPRKTGLRGGEKLYRAILNGKLPVADFQLLCANCNQIKRFENGEGCRARTMQLTEIVNG